MSISPQSCPVTGPSDARKIYFRATQTVEALPTQLGIYDWLKEEGITLESYDELLKNAESLEPEAWNNYFFLNIGSSERPILDNYESDLALRRWTESRNAGIIEAFLLEYGESILNEIIYYDAVDIQSEIDNHGGLLGFFGKFGDKKFDENQFGFCKFHNGIREIIQSKFCAFLGGKLTLQEERIMALFSIQPGSENEPQSQKVLKSFQGGIGQLVADSSKLIGNSVTLFEKKHGILPLGKDIDDLFLRSFRSQVTESAFGNHSLDQIRRRNEGRSFVTMSDTGTVAHDTARMVCDYLTSVQHMETSAKARLRFRCPFIRGRYTTEFLELFKKAFLQAFHRNYDKFFPSNTESDQFL